MAAVGAQGASTETKKERRKGKERKGKKERKKGRKEGRKEGKKERKKERKNERKKEGNLVNWWMDGGKFGSNDGVISGNWMNIQA